jgi:hypothetical protein
VQDSQRFNQTSDPTLAKLLEVDSQLAAQEAKLSAKLQDIQEKSTSLKTVISLFTPADAPATVTVEEPTEALSTETLREPEPIAKELATPQETAKGNGTVQPQMPAMPDTQLQEAKKTPSSVRTKQNSKSAPLRKTARKTEGWQQYLREEFDQTALSEAVTKVLQRQLDTVLEIPAIVDVIFVDEIPQAARTKARRQITNILSEGVRKNKWYRGQPGGYSMSKAAAEAVVLSS